MSNAPSTLPTESAELPGDRLDDPTELLGSAVRLVTVPVQCVSFWAAVSLPFLYLPLLFGGFTAGERTAFVALLVVHAVALVGGRNYGDA